MNMMNSKKRVLILTGFLVKILSKILKLISLNQVLFFMVSIFYCHSFQVPLPSIPFYFSYPVIGNQPNNEANSMDESKGYVLSNTQIAHPTPSISFSLHNMTTVFLSTLNVYTQKAKHLLACRKNPTQG